MDIKINFPEKIPFTLDQNNFLRQSLTSRNETGIICVMGLFSFLGVLSPVHIHLVTFLTRARQIGQDGSGNVYYQAKARKGYHHPRRWVIYKGDPDASSVPPEYHGWLHYQTDAFPGPDQKFSFRRSWQKPHKPNLTGTEGADLPPGHLLKTGIRPNATSDYRAWTPENSSSYSTDDKVA